MKKRVVIYARFSSHSQTEQSIEGQLRECYDFARRNDYLVIAEYIDRALTGTTDKRPEFLRMIEDSKKKNFDYVLVILRVGFFDTSDYVFRNRFYFLFFHSYTPTIKTSPSISSSLHTAVGSKPLASSFSSARTSSGSSISPSNSRISSSVRISPVSKSIC